MLRDLGIYHRFDDFCIDFEIDHESWSGKAQTFADMVQVIKEGRQELGLRRESGRKRAAVPFADPDDQYERAIKCVKTWWIPLNLDEIYLNVPYTPCEVPQIFGNRRKRQALLKPGLSIIEYNWIIIVLS